MTMLSLDWFRGSSSVGRAQASQAWGRGFEPRFPLEGRWCSGLENEELTKHSMPSECRWKHAMRAPIDRFELRQRGVLELPYAYLLAHPMNTHAKCLQADAEMLSAPHAT